MSESDQVLGDDQESLHRRGRAERRRGDLDRAIETFTAACRRFPEEARPLIQRGAVLVLVHRYDEALSDYHAAERLDPSYPGLWSYYAEAYLYLRRPADALSASERGLAAEPDDLMHRINRAHSLLYLDRLEEARAAYLALVDQHHDVKQLTGAEIVLRDFDLSREAGITCPGTAAIRTLLESRPN
jgi:tetratricopeptide (TPR) repeat protein